MQNQACKQYLVSDTLLKAQDYYNGRQNIWVPKGALESQILNKEQKFVHARIPPARQEWRPTIVPSLAKISALQSRETMQWVSKCQYFNDANANRHPCNENKLGDLTTDPSPHDATTTSILLTEKFQQAKNSFNSILNLFKSLDTSEVA